MVGAPVSAHERVLLGDLRQANEEFKQGASLDDANVQAVTGMIFCQLSSGQLLDAEQQIDFMKEIQTSIGSSYCFIGVVPAVQQCLCRLFILSIDCRTQGSKLEGRGYFARYPGV